MTAAYDVVSWDDLERFPVDDEGLTWRPVRRHFDIRAFGANAYSADEAGGRVVEEHSESQNHHEELYVVARGRATFSVADEEVDAPVGTLVFVRPGTRRGAVAAEPNTLVLALGGRVGHAFEPSGWEIPFAAYGYRRNGEPERGRRVLEEAVERDPAVWQAHYHLACFDALEGRRDSALERLAHAIELEPEAARWAAEDSDFDAVRDDPRFPTPES